MLNIQLDWQLSQKQSQQFKLHPQMLRDIRLLQLPLIDLQLQVQTELENNPALEATASRQEESLEEYQENYNLAQERREDEFSLYATNSSTSGNRQEAVENVLTRPQSLHEHLVWQLSLQPIDPRQRAIAEMIIDNLDSNGFHRSNPFEVIKAEHAELESLIAIIQQFDPLGICVADTKESLVLQARSDPLCPPAVQKVVSAIIENHLVLLKREDHGAIARALRIPSSVAASAVHYIAKLTPYPGRKYSQEPTQFAIPDVTVHYHNHQFEIYINEQGVPQLGINRYFLTVSEQTGNHQKDSAELFARTYVNEAHLFIRSLRRRYRTLLRTAQALVKFQGDFFRSGERYIKPLTLKDIAQELNLHETTISRVTHYKYIQTDWGVYPLRHLFGKAVQVSSQRRTMSRQAIKDILAELIATRVREQQPIRDHFLVEDLAHRGIHIARRTVAKYRIELELGSRNK